MGKRKKAAKKPATPSSRQRAPLDSVFTCIFCHHDKTVNVKIDKKEGLAQLGCKICGQKFQGRVHHLTEPIDVYSEWIDAADAAQREVTEGRRAVASSSRTARARAEASDDE